jgi:hypothetical protein
MNDLRPSVNGIITGNLISTKIERRKKNALTSVKGRETLKDLNVRSPQDVGIIYLFIHSFIYSANL